MYNSNTDSLGLILGVEVFFSIGHCSGALWHTFVDLFHCIGGILEVVIISSQLCQCRRLVLHERDDSVKVPSFTRPVHRPPVHKPGVPPDGLTRLQVWQDGLDKD